MKKPRLAVFKFASCDGCQLQILNAEDELLALGDAVELAYFPEAQQPPGPGPVRHRAGRGQHHHRRRRRPHRPRARRQPHPGDHRRMRDRGRHPGAAQLGGRRGVQARRLPAPRVDRRAGDLDADRRRTCVSTTSCGAVRSTCGSCSACCVRCWPVSPPALPAHSVCLDCKRRGLTCVVVAHGEPCLGPVTRTGCGAICPGMQRGCYGCFGPCDDPNLDAFTALLASQGLSARRGGAPTAQHQRLRAGVP